MYQPDFFQQRIEEEIRKIFFPEQPSELYDPIRYMLSLGGKRMRPALVLMSCELFGSDFSKAISPALGIEVFHNFTLLHDDIMDKAPLRRAKPTVHKKWNADVAILSGDTMFVKACELMMDVDASVMKNVLQLFFKTSTEVCEGQQWDMTFESKDDVSIADYLHMIELKTAVLLACSLKTGALIANASSSDAEHIYDFGKNLGIAFQLHDDILDVYGDEKKFGKQSGGDITSNKKTFLLLKAFELAKGETLEQLRDLTSDKNISGDEKVKAVKEIYFSLGVKELAEKEMNTSFAKAISSLDAISVSEEGKVVLKTFAERLMVREA